MCSAPAASNWKATLCLPGWIESWQKIVLVIKAQPQVKFVKLFAIAPQFLINLLKCRFEDLHCLYDHAVFREGDGLICYLLEIILHLTGLHLTHCCQLAEGLLLQRLSRNVKSRI